MKNNKVQILKFPLLLQKQQQLHNNAMYFSESDFLKGIH